MTNFFFRSLYLPHRGMFCELPADLSLGQIQVTSNSLSTVEFPCYLDWMLGQSPDYSGHLY